MIEKARASNTCATCRFWMAPPVGLPRDAEGRCRRYPPAPVATVQGGRFVVVSEASATRHFDWCGEHAVAVAADE